MLRLGGEKVERRLDRAWEPGKFWSTADRSVSLTRDFRAGSISVVVPVHNEVENLPVLHERLCRVLECLGRPYEICYVDDGSTDGSLVWLLKQVEQNPYVRVVELARNFGQHAAILAGFAQVTGDVVVTLDADLQNPPEEIPKLVAAMDSGFDVVGGWRVSRQDPWPRRLASRLINAVARLALGTPIHDHGCMLRAYTREIVQAIVARNARPRFIPAIAQALARRSTEVFVHHAPRLHGKSKYSVRHLFRLACDLLTSFSSLPVQLLRLSGGVVTFGGVLFGCILLIRHLVMGAEAEGLWALCTTLLVCLGILLSAVARIGEYVGWLEFKVQRAPAYRIRALHGFDQR